MKLCRFLYWCQSLVKIERAFQQQQNHFAHSNFAKQIFHQLLLKSFFHHRESSETLTILIWKFSFNNKCNNNNNKWFPFKIHQRSNSMHLSISLYLSFRLCRAHSSLWFHCINNACEWNPIVCGIKLICFMEILFGSTELFILFIRNDCVLSALCCVCIAKQSTKTMHQIQLLFKLSVVKQIHCI